MSISSLSIQRPVLTIVLSIAILLFGGIGFYSLGVREYPAIDPPIITVATNYSGANAEIVESQITEPLEESINGIDGIRSITSASAQGLSTITVEFNLNSDLETAANDVRDRVSRVTRLLPGDIDAPPVVTKADASSDAIVALTVSSSSKNLLELSDYATNVVKQEMQTIPGVSSIQVWGEKKYAMRLWLDPARLSAFGLTVQDVKAALDRENLELPSGQIQGNMTQLNVRTMGRFISEDDFNNMIIAADVNGQNVKMKDVGYAQLGPEIEETILKQSGIPMVGLGIVPQPGSNYVAIANEFYKRLAELKNTLPPDVMLNVALDNTKFIKESIDEVKQTLLIAFTLVVVIIFLFLRDWRSTIIPTVAIPISLIGTFFIMYVAGFSINVLTLLAVVLATGLVVDDAIVVLENIYSKVENGMSPMEASFKGSTEIFFAIISTTVTLAAVFLPIVFLEGFTGRLFREFGVVIAGSVLISAFVSLTLTPMMCSRILKHTKRHSKFYEVTERFFEQLLSGYRRSLDYFLNRRAISLVLIGVCIGLIYLFNSLLHSELAPLEDRSLVRVLVTAPEGSSFDYTDGFMNNLVRTVNDSIPEKQYCISVTAPSFTGSGASNTGYMRVVFVSPKERQRTQQQLADYLAGQIKKFPEARAFILQEQTIAVGSAKFGQPVQFVIQAQNFEKLKQVIPKFMALAYKDSILLTPDVNLKFSNPELRISIDRERANALGVNVQDIARTLQLSLSGTRFGYFMMNDKQYQVIGQLEKQFRGQPLDLKTIYIKNNKGELIQLDNLVNLEENSSPPQLFHYDRNESATITAGLAPGKTIGDGIDEMNKIAKQVLDNSFSTTLTGASRDFEESSSNILFAFLLALVLIYLVLAAQFESFRDPFIIMLTVPLAFAGALFSLWIFNQTLNIFSEIGVIMLIGLVTKNAILIVEFANQRKEQGLSKFDAVRDASASRFRPILMTSLATVLGALPIALALGSGSESRVSMGITVIGGLMFALVLTLFVIPAMYLYLSKEKKVLPATVPQEAAVPETVES
jgi:hydrophobe/amphiphile efflux-1 (HAE1) family protein